MITATTEIRLLLFFRNLSEFRPIPRWTSIRTEVDDPTLSNVLDITQTITQNLSEETRQPLSLGQCMMILNAVSRLTQAGHFWCSSTSCYVTKLIYSIPPDTSCLNLLPWGGGGSSGRNSGLVCSETHTLQLQIQALWWKLSFSLVIVQPVFVFSLWVFFSFRLILVTGCHPQQSMKGKHICHRKIWTLFNLPKSDSP